MIDEPNSPQWTQAAHPGRTISIAVVCAFGHWAVVLAALGALYMRPLRVEGIDQRIVGAPAGLTVGAATLTITFVASLLAFLLNYGAKSALQLHFALRLQRNNGIRKNEADAAWTSLNGSFFCRPNKYTPVLVNAIVGGAIIASQFSVFTSSTTTQRPLNVTGVNLDQLEVTGLSGSEDMVWPYYSQNEVFGVDTGGQDPSFHYFYTAMQNSNINLYSAANTSADASFSALGRISNSLVRPAENHADPTQGGLVYQHRTAFGATADVVKTSTFAGQSDADDVVTTCGQVFTKDAVECKWYTADTGVITDFGIYNSGLNGGYFSFHDPDLELRGRDLNISDARMTASYLEELDDSSYVVVFASMFSGDMAIAVGNNPSAYPGFEVLGASFALVSGRCVIQENVFRLASLQWTRVGTVDVAVSAADDFFLGCSNNQLGDPNEPLPHNTATSTGRIIAEHIQALLTPPDNVQAIGGLGSLVKSRLTKAFEMPALEGNDMLTYVITGLLASGMTADLELGTLDTAQSTAIIDFVRYETRFGVKGSPWVLASLAIPASSTLLLFIFLARIGRKNSDFPADNLFELSLLTSIPRQSVTQEEERLAWRNNELVCGISNSPTA
ncbi:uncharacterized protein J7T54_005262 [Emericellopsis cladophorae]|uniref:Uncharacterized protein n=1 Tax=Emericellopsis cladophorae TaxID=2686198 RepID=A0A9Q0BE71_9HYPO|nr:uncharacterized protein J7T54_005262 [Emericellopsis cladophorae]KAI6781551.1 hypothetical protein J7T54_005262 [Emericellopsis cladophorae]